MTETTNKADIIELALQKAAFKGAVMNPDSTTELLAGRVFEAMMPALENKGIYLGWIKDEDSMSPTIDSESGLPDWSVDAISSLLANKLCTYIPMPDNRSIGIAAESKALERSLYSKKVTPRQNNPYMPVGAGNKSGAYSPCFQSTETPVTVENDGNLGDLTVD
jgi:hypothetical protein